MVSVPDLLSHQRERERERREEKVRNFVIKLQLFSLQLSRFVEKTLEQCPPAPRVLTKLNELLVVLLIATLLFFLRFNI